MRTKACEKTKRNLVGHERTRGDDKRFMVTGGGTVHLRAGQVCRGIAEVQRGRRGGGMKG